MTKPVHTLLRVLALANDGVTTSEVARRTGVARATVRDWCLNPDQRLISSGRAVMHSADEPCPYVINAPRGAYAYLLGQYLGDGCISAMGPRGVFKLRVATCDAYPDIRYRCILAIHAVMPERSVGVTPLIGCAEVSAYSKHWPCLFPQHEPGPKHERKIELVDWQQAIVGAEARQFLAGLIHSDGCRCVNNIVTRGKPYAYPRYFFSNVSEDILMLCAEALDRVGVEWRRNRWNSLSVAKRESVALLDTFIGPKT